MQPNPTPTLREKETQLVRQLLLIENAQERIAILMDQAVRPSQLGPSEKTEANRVLGCVSRVWIAFAIADGKCRIRYEAESPMVRGLVGLVCRLYDGADPAEAANFQPALLEELGLEREISPTRLNGLRAVIARIRSCCAPLGQEF